MIDSSSDDDDEEDDDDDDNDEEEEEKKERSSYNLREHKPRTQLFEVPVGNYILNMLLHGILYILVALNKFISQLLESK